MTKDDLPCVRIVSYIDILGFKSLVNEMEKHLEKYMLIKDALEDSQKMLGEMYERLAPLQPIQKAQFSDSIVITTPINNNEIGMAEISIILLSYSILLTFMTKGIFIRGGIAKGRCYHDGNIIFGKGMLDAYDLESNVASYPRIIVADEVVNSIPEHYQYIKKDFLKRDSDGFWYINAFNYSPIVRQIRIINKDVLVTNNKLVKIKQNIINKLEESKDLEPSIKAKYRWLAIQFNASLDEYKRDKDVSDLISDVDKINF